jgi:hypothetical protein
MATGAPGAAEHDQAKSRAYANADAVGELWTSAGLNDVMTGELMAGAHYAGFDDLWVPLTIPDGAPGKVPRHPRRCTERRPRARVAPAARKPQRTLPPHPPGPGMSWATPDDADPGRPATP